jgi:putative sigma-54 modulation protein
MEVTVSSRHAEVSPALRAAAVEKIGRLDRFLDGLDRAEVHFETERNPRIAAREVCEITMAGSGQVIRAKVVARDPFAAVDLAVEQLEPRLSRLHKRLVARSRPRHTGAAANGDGTEAAAGGAGAPHDLEEALRIVKVKRFALQEVSVDDAALRMELLGHDFYLFTNIESGLPSVLYRRGDGDLGLIEQAG